MNFLSTELNPFSFQVLATVSYSCHVFSYTVFIVRDVSVLLFLCWALLFLSYLWFYRNKEFSLLLASLRWALTWPKTETASLVKASIAHFPSARIIAIIVTRKVICLFSLGLFPKKTISSFKSNFLSDIVMHNLYRYSSSRPNKKTALNELTTNAKVGPGFFF